MLSELEKSVLAAVAASVEDREGLAVVRAPRPLSGLGAGEGRIRVGLSRLGPAGDGFRRETVELLGTKESPTSRRVVELEAVARIEFRRAPETDDEQGLADARGRLLEDVSLVGHRLGDPAVRDGARLGSTAEDPGFRALACELDDGTFADESAAGELAAELRYRVRTRIWPPEPPEPVGRIEAVEPFLAAGPLDVAVEGAPVAAGGTATLRLRGLGGTRLARLDPETRGPVTLAVAVLSDLEPVARGRVTSGTAADSGVRLVPAAEPVTEIVYAAPAGDLGATRSEFVMIHLATLDGARGVLLGSVEVPLRGES